MEEYSKEEQQLHIHLEGAQQLLGLPEHIEQQRHHHHHQRRSEEEWVEEVEERIVRV